jgi:hypothetical protein
MGLSTEQADTETQNKDLLALAADSPGKFISELCRRLGDETGTRGANWTELFKEAMKLRPMLDVELARALVAGVADLDEDLIVRVLKILEDVSPTSRTMPALARLSGHKSLRVQSKITRMQGRDKDYLSWLPQYLEHPDARVRANAIEAVRLVDTPATRALLRSLLSDPNNRVAGNALLALYRLGEKEAVQLLIAMASLEDQLFRATAAWVMGETGNPVFRDTLENMRLIEKGIVWRNVMRALNRIIRAPQNEPARSESSTSTSSPPPQSQLPAGSPEPVADTLHTE